MADHTIVIDHLDPDGCAADDTTVSDGDAVTWHSKTHNVNLVFPAGPGKLAFFVEAGGTLGPVVAQRPGNSSQEIEYKIIDLGNYGSGQVVPFNLKQTTARIIIE